VAGHGQAGCREIARDGHGRAEKVAAIWFGKVPVPETCAPNGAAPKRPVLHDAAKGRSGAGPGASTSVLLPGRSGPASGPGGGSGLCPVLPPQATNEEVAARRQATRRKVGRADMWILLW
jgi:hypothetical protein